MKRQSFLVTLSIVTVFISSSFASTAYAYSANVKILDLERNVICDTGFTGTVGMDSIINTASSCGYTYELGFGDDFLDSINGVGWDGTNWWALYIDGEVSNVGINDPSITLENTNILWVFSDGSYIPPVQSLPILSNGGGGVIVGLISSKTGGLLDSDGDDVSDRDERRNGTDPYFNEEYHQNIKNMSNLASALFALEAIIKKMYEIF